MDLIVLYLKDLVCVLETVIPKFKIQSAMSHPQRGPVEVVVVITVIMFIIIVVNLTSLLGSKLQYYKYSIKDLA